MRNCNIEKRLLWPFELYMSTWGFWYFFLHLSCLYLFQSNFSSCMFFFFHPTRDKLLETHQNFWLLSSHIHHSSSLVWLTVSAKLLALEVEAVRWVKRSQDLTRGIWEPSGRKGRVKESPLVFFFLLCVCGGVNSSAMSKVVEHMLQLCWQLY